MDNQRINSFIISALFFFISCLFHASLLLADISRPTTLPVNEPLQVTSEAEPVLYGSVSQDGKLLVYTAQRGEFLDLWLRSAEPAVKPILPQQLTSDPANETAPVFSPNGRYIAYVGTGYDVKGDIYILDLKSRDKEPRRLTDRDTEDGAPCFASDNRTIFFHQVKSGTGIRVIVRMDFKTDKPSAFLIDTGGDSSFPAVSPDGRKLAFVSYRNDPGGDIFVSDIDGKNPMPLTDGDDLDLYPAWSQESRFVYFSRFFIDTNRDGQVNLQDNAVLFRSGVPASIFSGAPPAYPITSASYSSISPVVIGEKVFFLSDRKGVTNVWVLPEDGEIPTLDSASEQFALAQKIADKVPPDLSLTILAYFRVIETFSRDKEFAGRASFEIGQLFRKLGFTRAAQRAFQRTAVQYESVQPESTLSQIALSVINTENQWDSSVTASEKENALEIGFSQLDNIAARNSHVDIVQDRVLIEKARLLLNLAKDADSLVQAIDLLSKVRAGNDKLSRTAKAESMVLKARVFEQLGQADRVYPIYLEVVDRYSDIEQWADKAVDMILDMALAQEDLATMEERVGKLQNIASQNKEKRPRLAIAALNRVGDIYYNEDEWAQAKAAYSRVLNDFSEINTQTAAARLSLAEINYKEERFRKALDLYEKEMGERRPYEDSIYRLARVGYIQKSIDAGEFLYRIGEVASARTLFKDLITYDNSIVEAHRGYIKCAAAQNEIEPILKDYKEQLKKEPDNPVIIYAAALCMTYLNNERALKKAKSLVARAIELKGDVEYFHQTYGYILEVSETVYGKEGQIELALESYRKAYSLNDHENNPHNAANLLLNMANGHYLLGQYDMAFRYYSQRLDTGIPFDNKETEILFYRRFGETAYQADEPEKTIEAYQKAVDLINARMDPKSPSEAFDRVIRYVMDQVIAPIAQEPSFKKRADKLAKDQSEIQQTLFEITEQDVLAPPNPSWNLYQQKLEQLLPEQEDLNSRCLSLVKSANLQGMEYETVRQTLEYMTERVNTAITFPKRLVQLQAEMLDRLGFAFQEAEYWHKAQETFKTVFQKNQALGLMKNLAPNLRSAAYNTYMLAQTVSGNKREELLKKASEDFQQVIELVEKYGVPERKDKDKKGWLIKIFQEVAIDEITATEAAYGFSAVQEKRLAEAFISRITVELGQLIPAEQAIETQVAAYPPDKFVPEKDQYGVSILFHRAGHIAYARKEYGKAFNYFRRSAELAYRMANPVSSAVNAANMAHVLAKTPPNDPFYEQYRNEFRIYDKEISRLLADNAASLDRNFFANYHNTIGTYFFVLPPQTNDSDIKTALNVERVQAGVAHFVQGIKTVDALSDNRESMAYLGVLHLNMAYAASVLGENADDYLNKALAVSEKAMLPDLQWRALAQMGRLEQALDVLQSVTFLQLGSGPQEITQSFSPLVAQMVQDGKVEEAFNLAEELSEIERVQRMTRLFLEKPTAGQTRLFQDLYPRLMRIEQLKQQLSQAQETDVDYLTDSLEKERELLRQKAGEGLEKLPEIVSFFKSQDSQEKIMLLMAAAFMAENAAESVLNGKESASLYDEKVQQYHKIRQSLIHPREELVPEGVIAIFGPNPVQSGDLMMELPDDAVFLRLFKVQKPQEEFIVFTLTQDNLEAQFVDSLDRLAVPSNDNVYIAYEEPDELPNLAGVTYVLSATHLDRALMNRKPFKRLLLTYPDKDIDIPENYSAKILSGETSPEELLAQLPGTHTLMLNSKVGVFTTVPTRQGRIPEQFTGLQMDKGQHLPLIKLGESLFNTGLVILTNTNLEDAYTTGHFFSLFGCPTVIFAESRDKTGTGVTQFLKAYSNESAAKAVARVSLSSNNQWRQFGFQGMTQEQANAFAKEHFVHYVQEAQAALQVNDSITALNLFENALLIAQESTEYSQYLPDLYFSCRESAYQAKQYDKALEYAKALVELYKKEYTNSEQQAQAFMVLGLLQSRYEQYEDAIKSLKSSLDIIESLALENKKIQVLDSMGVVLENATEYDRALEKYMDAARLSQSFNQDEWLAQQYINLGRIYDLRLSQYARAKLFYEKALDVYKNSGNQAGAAGAHLDIGRCYRLLGNFHDAESHYDLALQKAKNDTSEAGRRMHTKIIIEQANNAWFQARYQDAMNLQTASYKDAKQNNWHLEQVIALNTAGLIWWTLGDNDKSLRKLKDALTLAKSLESRSDEVATTLNNIGIVYREMEQYEQAIESFNRAIEIDRKLKSRWAMAYDLRNKGLTLLRMGKAEEAVALFQEAVNESHAIGNRINESKAFLALGQAYKVLKNYAEAEKSLKKALELAKNMALREVQWRCMFELAELKLKQGRQESARQLLTEAIDVIETMRADIKILQLRDGFISNKLTVYETLVHLLIDMGRPDKAFDVAERSRARNFIDLLGNQRLNLYGAVNQELYNRYQTLRSRIEENEALMAQAPDKTEQMAYQEILERVKDEYQELLIEIMQKNPELASIVSVNPMNLGDVKALLEPGIALVIYYVVPDLVFTWIVTKTKDELVKTAMDRDALGEQVLRYRQMIQNLNPVEEQSERLYSLLVNPVLPHIQGQKTLGIIPHGSLHHLSFATLSDGENYLVDSYPLFYLPSASVMRYTIGKRRDDKNVNVLAIGNPELEDPALALPFAEHEVEAIKWNFPQIKIVTGKEATESWVLEHIENYGIIHLASHGEFDPVNPLFSAIKLRSDAVADGDFRARDVFGIHLNADLVVLSACQTGLGKITKGDEVIGLNRAFFYAGTHAIVATLWRVSDVSTAILIKQFYRSYTRKNKADSLRRAMLHVKNRYPHPGYWGAFTLVGDYY